jgi:hypothetical protein
MPLAHRRRNLALATALLACHALPAAAQKGTWDPVAANTTHPVIAVASDDTINPLRGYYRWRNQEVIPQAEPARDAYQRYYWKDFEPVAGQYDFSTLLADLAAAKSQGR